MDPNQISLENITKMFEYEKVARDIDSITDTETLRNFAKSYAKLYLSQQEAIANLKF
jgi:hypothetical protein